MPMPKQKKDSMNPFPDARWRDLFKAGAIAAILAGILILIEMAVFTLWPLPATVAEYFTLLQNNRLIGLIDFYLLEFIAYTLFIPMFLSIYIALKRFNNSYMTIALALVFIGIAVFLSTNNPFSMLSLSDQYALAATEAKKSLLLGAGEAILANANQRATGGFNMGFLLLTIGGLIMSVVMFRSKFFSKITAGIGLVTFFISIIDYFRIILIPSATLLLILIASISGLLLLIWIFLIAKELLQLTRS